MVCTCKAKQEARKEAKQQDEVVDALLMDLENCDNAEKEDRKLISKMKAQVEELKKEITSYLERGNPRQQNGY